MTDEAASLSPKGDESFGSRFKAALDRNLPLAIAGVLITGISIGAAPIIFVKAAQDSTLRERDERIERLETQLGSVTRTVNEDTIIEFAVDDIVLSGDEAQDLPPSLQYIEGADIYAPPVSIGELADWSFEEMTERKLYELQGFDLSEADLPSSEAALDLPLYLWRGAQRNSIALEPGAASFHTFPFVAVERINEDALSDILSSVAGTDEIRNFMADDPLSAMFQLNVIQLTASFGTNLSPIVTDIQRSQRAIYAEITLIYRDVIVDGIQVESFYIKRELLFLDAGDDIVFIVSNLPSSDRRPAGSSAVTSLLVSMRIVD